jgi:hypothetical protein
MDPIQPIEPRSRWIPELAQVQSDRAKIDRRKRRTAPHDADRGPQSDREPTHEEHGTAEGTPGSGHIDVRA